MSRDWMSNWPKMTSPLGSAKQDTIFREQLRLEVGCLIGLK